MERIPKVHWLLPVIVGILVLLVVGFVWMVVALAKVSGSARLPSGAIVSITTGATGFSVSETPTVTTIDTSNHTFEFKADRFSVDGKTAGTLDNGTSLHLESSREGIRLMSDGNVIWEAK